MKSRPWHSYFVSEQGIWVHNAKCQAPKQKGKVPTKKGNPKREPPKIKRDKDGKIVKKKGKLERPAKGNGQGDGVWDMLEGGGEINGREYSQHAMERMAPNTPSVRAELSRRAEKAAESKGLKVGTQEYYDYCKKYVDPRNIPPMVIEDAIKNTSAVAGKYADTFIHDTESVRVIVNSSGKVVTVIPK